MFCEVGNFKYYNYYLFVNGILEVYKDDFKIDYFIDVIVS